MVRRKIAIIGTAAGELASEMAEIVPMDGFHYDNAVLDQLGLRQRKGAPQTFDFASFEITLRRVRDSETSVAVPTFDRSLDLSRAGARLVAAATRYVIVEGNYLLLDRPPWSGLARLFDVTVFLDAPRAELEARLLKRWTDLGYAMPDAEAKCAATRTPTWSFSIVCGSTSFGIRARRRSKNSSLQDENRDDGAAQ